MSADNGVYILQTKSEYRVKHLQAIDNLYWDEINSVMSSEPQSRMIVEMFGDCVCTRRCHKAAKMAFDIYESLPLCEDGIRRIYVDKTWNQILKESENNNGI